jgi:Transglycosylase SLT domain
LRIIFALTVALGVSAPTLTTSKTNNSLSYDSNDIAADANPTEMQKLLSVLVPTPRDDVPIVTKDDAAIVREAKLDPTVERDALIEEPAADEEEDDLPTTVPIQRVCEALADAANAQGLPTGFFARLIWQESRFDQWARSHAGAMGLAQFMPPTAAAYGLRDPFDPLQSVVASARFLRELRDQFGNLGLAAAAYNAGGGRIRKWLSGQSAMPEETRNYVNIITGHPPQRWTVQKPLEISFALPHRAPCDGVEGLSREAGKEQHHVRLTELSVELIEEAEAARRAAKIAAARAARNKRYAAAKAAKARKLAIVKVAAKSRVQVRVAERRTGEGS